MPLDAGEWERLPDRFSFTPDQAAEAADLLAAMRRAVEHELTERQRLVFTACPGAVDRERDGPRDVGCGEAMAVLHTYAELAAAGQDPAARYPGVSAQLASSGSCSEDFAGLLAAVTSG